MKLLDKRNVLELIGSNSRKYHSCIITCYSISFSFFEERVLPVLRSVNIKNVNILCDGKFLEQAQDHTSGKEFKFNKAYNFYPVYEKGVFHPKIMLLSGDDEGLLLIGSGNITSSGLSSNDEIWAAFQTNAIENNNAPVFGAAWSYLNNYLTDLPGFLSQKIKWIKQHSPWLKKVDSAVNWVEVGDAAVKFIYNSSSGTTFKEIKNSIDEGDRVEKATVVSPYYDNEGQFLAHLINELGLVKLDCFVEPYSGLLPYNLDSTLNSKIDFYDWAKCIKGFEAKYHRLHAKMLHFQTDNTEYLYLGSANATVAGMGLVNSVAINAEAGLLLRRETGDKTWLDQLGISKPKEKYTLNKSEPHHGFNETNESSNPHKHKILYSELKGNEIEIYFKNELTDLKIQVLDRADLEVISEVVSAQNKKALIQVRHPDEVFKLLAIDENGTAISNYSLVHRLESLLKGNPDSRQEKLDNYLNGEFNDGTDISELLKFVEFNWADEQKVSENKNQGSFSHKKPGAKATKENNYQELDYEEFNKESGSGSGRIYELISSPNVKIAEFLRVYSAGLFTADDDFEESEEQKLAIEEEQSGQGKEVDEKPNRKLGTEKERDAIVRFYRKLEEHFDKPNKEFLKSGNLEKLNKDEVTLDMISAMLVAIEIGLRKFGKQIERKEKYQIVAGIPPEYRVYYEKYFEIGEKNKGVDTIKGFLFNVYGAFLLRACSGIQHYNYDIVNQKVESNLKLLVAKVLALIFSLPWDLHDRSDKDLMIYNTLHFLNKSDSIDELLKQVSQELISSKYSSTFTRKPFDVDKLKSKYWTGYSSWANIYKDDDLKDSLFHKLSEISDGEIIFKPNLGFNKVSNIKFDGSLYSMTLSRSGYNFENNGFRVKNIQMVSKTMKFNV